MPFVTPWTDDSPENRALSTVRWHWERRAALRPESWTLQFLVRFRRRVVGTQSLSAGAGAGAFAGRRWGCPRVEDEESPGITPG